MIVVAIQCFLFFGYLIFIVKRFGWLESISKSWYKLNEDNKKQGWMFSVFLGLLGATMFIQNHEFGWYFYSGAGLFFTAIAAEYKEDHVGPVHYAGAAGSIALSAIGLAVEGIYFPVVGIAVAAILFRLFKISNLTLWVEIAAFIFIEAGFTAKHHIQLWQSTQQHLLRLL